MLKGKIDYSGVKLPKRTADEKKYLKKVVELIRESKERELSDQDEDEEGS
jgi:hypothetical protein